LKVIVKVGAADNSGRQLADLRFSNILAQAHKAQAMLSNQIEAIAIHFDGRHLGQFDAVLETLAAMREIYQSLDWTFYRNSDPNNPEDLALLDRAIDEGWNVTTFKENKFPSMKDPRTILERVMAMLSRNKTEWRPEIRAEIETIVDRLEKLLRLYAS
jgi:hypothetical protein